MDDADYAAAQQEALDAARLRRPAQPSARTAPGRDCLSCGEPIPDARLAAVKGAELCVECQDRLERAMGR